MPEADQLPTKDQKACHAHFKQVIQVLHVLQQRLTRLRRKQCGATEVLQGATGENQVIISYDDNLHSSVAPVAPGIPLVLRCKLLKIHDVSPVSPVAPQIQRDERKTGVTPSPDSDSPSQRQPTTFSRRNFPATQSRHYRAKRATCPALQRPVVLRLSTNRVARLRLPHART